MEQRHQYSQPETSVHVIRFEGGFLQGSPAQTYNKHGNEKLRIIDEDDEVTF